ncbi:MAG TPA: hypothetical protein ENI15_17090 [Spirochaetes bacterium]|nr:hypothetical protein [Spirochaetota bacterium]
MSKSFKKQKGSKNLDIDEAIQKLKNQYREYSEEHGTKIFNLQSFEERYRNALANKIDLNTFLLAEIEVFKELKKKITKPDAEEKKNTAPTYSELADKIIEDNMDKIKGYRFIDFHPDAEEETKHFLGAITEFYYEVWGKINELIRTLGLKGTDDVRLKLENDFTFFAIPARGSYSMAVEDYVLALSRKNPADSDKAAVNFMRFGGILLNNCLRVVKEGLSTFEAMPESANKLRTLERYKDILIKIIEDFRMSAIRGY